MVPPIRALTSRPTLRAYFPNPPDNRADDAIAVPNVRPDVLVDDAIRFLEQNHGEKPVFVQVSFHSVHIPLDGRPATVAKYERKPVDPGYPSNPTYAAMVEDMDASVGRMIDALDRLGIAENTLLVFFSDNGGLRRPYLGGGEVTTSNAPLRGEKGNLYEGGIRVPLLVRWPGVVPNGASSPEPVTSVDLYPTFLDAAGVHSPANHVLDGLSLLPVLKGDARDLGREAIYWHYPHYHHGTPAGAIRMGRFKLIERFEDGGVELYDLGNDLSEYNNLASSQPKTALRLHTALAAWRRSVGAKLPTLNPEYDPTRADQWSNRRNGKPVDRASFDRQYGRTEN